METIVQSDQERRNYKNRKSEGNTLIILEPFYFIDKGCIMYRSSGKELY